MPTHEPERLRRGKGAHNALQAAWPETRKEAPCITDRGRKGRVDVLIDMADQGVGLVEIKDTDWDAMSPTRVRPNALRHARQVLGYVDHFLASVRGGVCAAVTYTQRPTTPGRAVIVEAILNDRLIQVGWES